MSRSGKNKTRAFKPEQFFAIQWTDMLRQLLALIALLTGIAAMGAPVQAAVNGAVNSAVTQTDARESDPRDQRAPCPVKKREQKVRGEKEPPCVRQEPVTVYIPSVMFGPDRAFE